MVFFAPERVWFAGIALLMASAAAEWANLAKFSQWSKVLYVMVMPILLALLWITFCSPKQSVGVFGCHVDVAGVLVAGRARMVVYELARVQSLGFGVVRSFGVAACWGVFLVHTPIAC